MPLYIADYLAKTTHLRAAESGAYLHLIMHYWQHKGLPDDDRKLASIAKLTDAEWKRHKSTLAEFFHDGWKHKRIDDELAHCVEVSNKRRAAAEQRHSKKDANAPAPDPANGDTLHTPQIGDGGGDAREAPISPVAYQLAERLHAAMGWERDDPRAIGNAYLAQKWLNSGWVPDLCVTTVERVKASARKPINALTYFEKPIAEAHAELQRPVPVAVVNTTPEQVQVNAASGNLLASADELIERSRQWDGYPDVPDLPEFLKRDVRSGEGAAVVRLLPQSGSK